ncbi:MAG: zinc ribbon domain-containing protein [Candidatus Wallbacteria bacterium]
MKLCPNCEQNNKEEAKFCLNCGCRLFLVEPRAGNYSVQRFNHTDIKNFISNHYWNIKHNLSVTNNFFVYIEKGKKVFNEEYLMLTQIHGRDKLNTAIGYLIKNMYYWENCGRATAGNTNLIKSYEKHSPTSITIFNKEDFNN